MDTSRVVLALAVLCFCAVNAQSPTNATAQRNGKLFSVFQVVRFQNQACTGSSSKNGTCYTSSECTSKGGTSAGSCASGYGVCCVFALHCGSTSSQNCTYFESTGGESGACALTICKCNSNICQLRLDFNTFVISGPSTSTATVGGELNGSPAFSVGKGKKYSLATACLTDTFSITNPGGTSPPLICGTNTGYHMYVDASSSCNKLAFELGQTASGTSLASRQWSIKITQYSCDYNNLAPEGCTQWFYGGTTGCVYTYNYAGGVQLASQNQNVCVRKERSYCKICWYAAIATDVQLSGKAAASAITKTTLCCAYGTAGTKTSGYDCVSIPGAAKTTGKQLKFNRQCGRGKGLFTSSASGTKTVCSSTQPFSVRFVTDWFESTAENSATLAVPTGAKICYFESATNC